MFPSSVVTTPLRSAAESTTPILHHQHRILTTQDIRHGLIYLRPTWNLKGIASLCTSFCFPLTCSFESSMARHGKKWRGTILRPRCHVVSMSRLHQNGTVQIIAYARGEYIGRNDLYMYYSSDFNAPFFLTLPILRSRKPHHVTIYPEKCIVMCIVLFVDLSRLLANRSLAICQSVHRL